MAFENIDLKQFSGKLPIFPLPNVVHFPHTLLPLHIFEMRYRKLLEDALEGEKLIGMAVLKPGWEDAYQNNPEIYDVACMGQIVRHEPMEDGRSNILLLGLKRVQIKNILSPYPYRLAKVEILDDTASNLSDSEQEELRKELLQSYSDMVVELAGSGKKFPSLSDADLNASQLCDALAASLGFEVPQMVQMLSEPQVEKRAGMIQNKINAMLGIDNKKSMIVIPGKIDFKIHLN